VGAGRTFRLMMVCDDVSSNVLNALQLGKIMNRYRPYHNRQSWHNPIVIALKQLQLILPCYQL